MNTPTLTKFLDPADYASLDEDLRIVDHFPIGHEQHPHRRWEYAMCLRAIREWLPTFPDNLVPKVADVGGTGSSLRDVLDSISIPVRIIDPRENETLRKYRELCPSVRFPIVVCISTIEHVPFAEYRAFVDDLVGLISTRGLLFLTADAWSKQGPDSAHFHWMRERIYDRRTWRSLAEWFYSLGFRCFGGVDWEYHGDHVYDYSFCCMSLVKEGD